MCREPVKNGNVDHFETSCKPIQAAGETAGPSSALASLQEEPAPVGINKAKSG